MWHNSGRLYKTNHEIAKKPNPPKNILLPNTTTAAISIKKKKNNKKADHFSSKTQLPLDNKPTHKRIRNPINLLLRTHIEFLPPTRVITRSQRSIYIYTWDEPRQRLRIIHRGDFYPVAQVSPARIRKRRRARIRNGERAHSHAPARYRGIMITSIARRGFHYADCTGAREQFACARCFFSWLGAELVCAPTAALAERFLFWRGRCGMVWF